jgi:hypothetical protein
MVIELRERAPALCGVDLAQQRLEPAEERRTAEKLVQGLPVLVLPPSVHRRHVADRALVAGTDRDRQPLQAIAGLDSVAVAPAARRKLGVVVEHEDVGVADEIEIALPRKVRGLVDDDPRHGRNASSSTMSA